MRAMREGVRRDGRHLYPVFPYDHFTRVADDEVRALYAFLMTREPVHARTPENDLVFPMNVRMLVAGWKLLFFEQQAFGQDATQSVEWNRGAYLAEGLGHCGSCHTPRNLLGRRRNGAIFAGGEVEGWHAPALNASSRTPVPWSIEALERYLTRGVSELHEVAAGPMARVVAQSARKRQRRKCARSPLMSPRSWAATDGGARSSARRMCCNVRGPRRNKAAMGACSEPRQTAPATTARFRKAA